MNWLLFGLVILLIVGVAIIVDRFQRYQLKCFDKENDMGMHVDAILIKSMVDVDWTTGFPKVKNPPDGVNVLLIPENFLFAVGDEDSKYNPIVPTIQLGRDSVLFALLGNFERPNMGLELPGIKERISATSKFVDFLTTGRPNFLDWSETNAAVCEDTLNIKNRYLFEYATQIVYPIDYLLSINYDAPLNDAKGRYAGKSLNELFEDYTQRDYFNLLNEARDNGWEAIMFTFE